MSGWSSIGAAGVWVYLLLIVALLLYANLKLWRIRHGMFRIADDAAKARRESEGLFSQLQSLMALERKLALSDALPPMRGWAGSPDFLLEVADQVHGRRPHTVVECGCGVSTIVMARCLQLNNSGHVYSMEHDPVFVVRTRSLLRRYGLSDWATVLHAPLKTVGTYTAWYDDQVLPTDVNLIDMLIVDGPPAGLAPLARAPALPRLLSRMAARFIVMLDDADRPDEIEIVRRWRALDPRLTEVRLACEKGLAILELS